ncbi:hypothetical protein ABF87_10655 [Nitrosomonas sp. JL21]|uniref:hypothetical protein n=1 Tax=Nitrosomonas sp. JL21 TaxID=153949 RepID=UPI00136C0FE7|nr:hypothetical protein [Nitrosomonas sp. JL21]MBL8496774.1 hypothetical protein [Nitrosomonas sp.]MBL8498474.1 hypothetical protein [Nitrosomonas sp.]MXS78410.1 hypothetical protein [Nitrosomonas sp. JL21]
MKGETVKPQRLLILDEETEQRILRNMREFRGVGTTLESALGALVLGQFFGWRVLKILHNPATYRKYEKVLGIEFKNLCPEITDFGQKKSIGYAITEKLGSFWAVVMGKRKVADKGLIDNQAEVEKHVAKHIAGSDGEEKK